MSKKPNITVRPNVFVRNSGELEKDHDFIQEIRGRNALLLIIERLRPGRDALAGAKSLFSQRQVSELVWDLPCVDCGAYPEGPVRKSGTEDIEFRCPIGRCKVNRYRGRTVLLDSQLVRKAVAQFGRPLTELVQFVLHGFSPPKQIQQREDSKRMPFTIGLTASQSYFFSDQDIEVAVAGWLRENVNG
jgi:hypothetical protein